MDIKIKLREVSSLPGIYIMKDAKDRAIYVGKAKNLKNRLRSYFQSSSSLDARKLKMVGEIRDFDYVVAKNELEALVLEANFIKRIKPKYNIILRDDKSYPYLKLTISEKWPRLEVARKIIKDGSVYFGPYVPSGVMWETLKFIRRYFELRTCDYNIEKPMRPCVQFQIGRCPAPCSETRRTKKDHDKYMETVSEIRLFLEGEKKELLQVLQKSMQTLSDELRYEEAAATRDRLNAIKMAWETQRVISPELGDIDFIGLSRDEKEAAIFVLFVRNGMVIGQKGFSFKKLEGIGDKELISYFMEQFYSKEMIIPPQIIQPSKDSFKIQRQWLSEKRGAPVAISAPKRDKESEVLKMAMDNACHVLIKSRKAKTEDALVSLKKLLNLKHLPERIAAVDVSNISGAEAVGAIVLWEDGNFLKHEYRLFKIKNVEGIDDFAMIEEVMARYFRGLSGECGQTPRLILIDGGKGQLASALRAKDFFELPVDIAAIAKERSGTARPAEAQCDRIFLPGQKDAIPLEPFIESTHLLQRIRDEVHRFAINYHKKLRARRLLESCRRNRFIKRY
ncbi:MAG: excinuclease ABC subunit UvrC [Nitrospirae bacterium]|nr:excinuclease ABC subunit UvrC [Nitrospirota bacterium]